MEGLALEHLTVRIPGRPNDTLCEDLSFVLKPGADAVCLCVLLCVNACFVCVCVYLQPEPYK